MHAPETRVGLDRNWIQALNEESDPAAGDSFAAIVAAAAVTDAELAAQVLVRALASVSDAARTVADASAEAQRAVALVVQAKAAVFAAAEAAATEARRTEARLLHEILHDGLTGLPNKRLLVDRLTQALARSKRAGTFVAVLFIDLDGFKGVNDTLGHAVGDQLLTAVASHLLACLRDTDTCARVGGDEFVIVCEDLSHASDAAMLAHRIESALASGVAVGRETMSVPATIGLAVSSGRSLPADLLHEADTAMYRAKGLPPAPDRRKSRPSADPRAGSVESRSETPAPHTRRRTDQPN